MVGVEVPGQARDGLFFVLRAVPDLEGVWLSCVAGEGAKRADVVLFVTLQERPPGGGRALPGVAAGWGLQLLLEHPSL